MSYKDLVTVTKGCGGSFFHLSQYPTLRKIIEEKVKNKGDMILRKGVI